MTFIHALTKHMSKGCARKDVNTQAVEMIDFLLNGKEGKRQGKPTTYVVIIPGLTMVT